MLLPAVQTVRESGRNVVCQNRLRQINLAISNFHSTRKRLPPGTLGFADVFDFDGNWFEPTSPYFWKNSQHTSFLGQILPFIELENEYYKIDQKAFVTNSTLVNSHGIRSPDWFGEISGVTEAIRFQPNLFLCPSDDFQAIQVVTGGSQPVFDFSTRQDGIAYVPLQDELEAPFGFTNYLGCSGAHSAGQIDDPEFAPYTGAMSSRRKISLNHIRDGASHSFLIGETSGGIRNGRRYAAANWFIGGLARGRGSAPWKQPFDVDDPNIIPLGDMQQSNVGGFGSPHKGFVNFGFADGSTRGIARTIHWETLYQLSGIADGGLPVVD